MGGNVSKKAKKRPVTAATSAASSVVVAASVVATKKTNKAGSLRRRRSSTYKKASKARKGRTATRTQLASNSSSQDDSGQGSLTPDQKGNSTNTAESDSDNLTCPFCDDLMQHQRPDSDTDDQLLYCSKGSLCSRRSRATVKSRKVPGKPKRKKKNISLRADNNDKNTDNIRHDLPSQKGQKGCS